MNSKELAYVSTISVLAILLVFSVSGTLQFSKPNTSSDSDINAFGDLSEIKNAAENPYSLIYEYADSSVVQLTGRVSANSNIIINGDPLEYQSTKLGSGFIFDSNGHIVTNNHVVNEVDTVYVTFSDGNAYSVKVVGRDKQSDIAVLEIQETVYENYPPLELADSSVVSVGDVALAIGNPFGLRNTMTAGIISYTGRLLPNHEIGFSIPDVIQTDAAINPGNSGGPLLDSTGRVIGMNAAIQSGTGEFSGIGFAIPSNTLKRIVPVLIEDGSYDHPWLGITGTSLTPSISESLGLLQNYRGVIVMDVVEDSAAHNGGIKAALFDSKQNIKSADIIIEFDGREIQTIDSLISLIDSKKVGDSVPITINRNGEEISLSVILQARP